MNKPENQLQFQNLYRHQLRRETKAMGYGQAVVYQPNNEDSESIRLASRQIIPAVLATLGLFTRQIQPSR